MEFFLREFLGKVQSREHRLLKEQEKYVIIIPIK